MRLGFQLSVIFIVMLASLSLAQPTRQQMEAITMPPPRYDMTTTLDYVDDYGYFYVGSDRRLSDVDPIFQEHVESFTVGTNYIRCFILSPSWNSC